MKSLIVYNICGISGRENVAWYIDSIKSILRQKGEFDVVVSSCLSLTSTRSILKKEFGEKISIVCIDEKVPVNITFNSTVREIVKYKGEYDYYLYVDSGMNFGYDDTIILNVDKLIETGEYSIATIQASNDNGFKPWLGLEGFVTKNDLVVPPGGACNAHLFAFSNHYFKKFDNKLWPDIFAAYCTESVFSYMAAATGKRWVILKDKIVYHLKGQHADGASSGFDHVGTRGQAWNNLLAGLDMNQILNQPEAWNSGFGYEECNKIFMHNPEAFDAEGNCKDPERLLNFMKTFMFLPEKVLNYEAIPSLLVK